MNGPSFANFPAPIVTIHSRFLPAPQATKHVLVLLHAFPFSSAMWEPVANEFLALRSDTAILLIDLPGFGRSTPRVQWNFSSFALELRGVIEQHTRKQVILGGLSMGGYAAFEFYRMNPDLVHALVLSNTRAEADSEKERIDRAVFSEEVLKTGAKAVMKRNYPNFVTEETNPKTAEQIKNWIFEATPGANASALMAMANRRDATEALPKISVPSLVIAS
ncbi:MAG TPA: alpha/beta hydrolase, partial [Candidatus Kapabacteria bacterium]